MLLTFPRIYFCILSTAAIIFLSSELAIASASVHRGSLLVGVELLNTSSEYESNSYNLKSTYSGPEQSDSSFNVGLRLSGGKASSHEFTFQGFEVGFQKEDSEVKYYSQLRLEKRTIQQSSDSLNILGYVGASWDFKDSNLSFELGQRGYGQEFQSLGPIRDNLLGAYYLFRFTFLAVERWQVRALNKTYFVSDGNERMDSDVALMYGISPGWPWIWVGLGAEFLTNTSANQGGYWSPRQFVNVGPRLDMAVPLSDKITFSTGLNLNKYNDIDFGDGTGFYVFSKLSYGKKDELRVEAGIEGISSEQNSNSWSSTMIVLGASCPF